jgi:hypothetical protein
MERGSALRNRFIRPLPCSRFADIAAYLVAQVEKAQDRLAVSAEDRLRLEQAFTDRSRYWH